MKRDNEGFIKKAIAGLSLRTKLIIAFVAIAIIPVSYTHLTLPTNREV